jgi:hypothetical protein
MSGAEEYELPVLQELCPLPKIRDKRASSRSQKATVLTSSEHVINIKNNETEKGNKDSSSKNRHQEERKPRSEVHKNTGQENADSRCMHCNGLYSEDRRGEIWTRYVQCNSCCHEECAGATKSKDLYEETEIKPLKTRLIEVVIL